MNAVVSTLLSGIGLVAATLGVFWGISKLEQETKDHPEVACEIHFVKHASGLCLAMCWGGGVKGGPAMTAVDDKYCAPSPSPSCPSCTP